MPNTLLLYVYHPVTCYMMSHFTGHADVVATCLGAFLVSAASLTRSWSEICMIFEEHNCGVFSSSLVFGQRGWSVPLREAVNCYLFRAREWGTKSAPCVAWYRIFRASADILSQLHERPCGCLRGVVTFSASARRRIPCFHPKYLKTHQVRVQLRM